MGLKDYRFTIGYTYYDEPDLLLKQLELWKNYPEVEIVLVDDASPNFPAHEIVKEFNSSHSAADLRLFRVDEDLGFNSHGCRNLIAEQAYSDYILFADIDCMFSPESIAFIKRVKFDPNILYRFGMFSLADYKFYEFPGAVNIFLTSKRAFWEAGGYDESFTGYHHGDREFLQRLAVITEEKRITESLAMTIVRGGRQVIIDKSVDKISYDNKNMIIYTPVKEKTYAEMKGSVKTKINFPYTQVL